MLNIRQTIRQIIKEELSRKRIVSKKPVVRKKRRLKEEVDFKSADVIRKINTAAAKMDAEISKSSDPILLVDSNRGRYIYKFFAKEYLDIDLDPEDEFYLEDYEDLENKINSKMKNGYISVEDDLWLFPNDYESDDDGY